MRTNLTSRTTAGTVLQSYTYELGPAGNRRSVTEADGTVRAYTYDALFRLVGEQVTGAGGTQVFDDRFVYDPVGNRTERVTVTADGTVTVPYTYDERDRLLARSATTFTWDEAGRLLSRSGLENATYTWDAEERLTQAETADGTVVTHTYDADGVRVQTTTTPLGGPAEVTDFLVDTSGALSQVVAETDGAGELTAYYVRGDDLLAVLRPTGDRFFHADGLGSIRALTNEAGAVTDRYAFKAFGELLEHQGSDPNAYLFAGEQLDPNSGFYYLRARWMAPGVGRFISVDPFGGGASEPVSLHKYLYAGNDPVNKVDPSGLSFLSNLSITITVRVMVFTMQHPFLTATLGFIFAALIPEEFNNALLGSSHPFGMSLGRVGQARARFFAFVKSQRFRSFISRNLRERGRAAQATGEAFEEFLARDLFRGLETAQIRLAGGRSVDFLFRGLFIEAKTSRRLGARELRQLKAIAEEAAGRGIGFTYLFLNKPTPASKSAIEKAGGVVLWIFD